jgi:very-short-patch-repair endonuclease
LTKINIPAVDELAVHIHQAGLPAPVREHKFHPTRKWAFDFAWPAYKIAAEVDGGAFTQGRHTRGAGFTEDCAKGNAAIIEGWSVLHFTTAQVQSNYAIETIQMLFGLRKG